MWVLPAEPRPVRLMNTVWADRAGVHDDLTSVEALGAWLADAEMPVTDARDTDLAQALSLRDGLRRLAAVATADGRTRAATGLTAEQALTTVNAALALAPPAQLHLTTDAVSYAPPPGAPDIRQALAVVATEGADLLTAADAPLRACLAPGCVLYFVKDHPRRAWCSTTCGNRARAARHYARHRE
jgi:predicted RNA-binding Zn ribbon-like protein